MPRPAPVREWTFPAPFCVQQVVAVPLAEIVTISRHIAARNVCSYLNMAPLRDLEDPRTPVPIAADPSGRSSQQFVMEIHATSPDHRAEIAVAGRDIYAITASIVAEACARMLTDRPATGGAFAPAELFDAGDFLHSLEPHLAIVRTDGDHSARRQ